MAEIGQGRDAPRGLTRVPREYIQTVLSPSGKPESVDIVKAYAEYKRPEGIVVRRVHGSVEVIVPYRTEFPKDTGLQYDIVDSTYNTAKLGIHPLLSDKADPKVAMRTIAVGLAVEKEVIKRSHNPWANFNVGTMPAVTPDAPDVLQWDRLVASVIGRSSKDPRWAQPKPFSGVWGQNYQEQYGPDPLEKVREDLDRERNVLPASAGEIAEHKKDPMKWTTDEKPPSPTNKADYAGWREDPIGKYIGWDTDSRTYTADEIDAMRKLVNSENFDRTIAQLEQIDLFSEGIELHTDFEHSAVFPPNDTDTVVWEAKIGNRYYEVVTKRIMQKDTRAHVHVQRFIGEIAPAPGTFTENKPQTPEKVEDIRAKLNHKETGLAPRLLERYRGKIFAQAA